MPYFNTSYLIDSNLITSELTKNRSKDSYAEVPYYSSKELNNHLNLEDSKQRINDLKYEINTSRLKANSLRGYEDTLNIQLRSEIEQKIAGLEYNLNKETEELRNSRLRKAELINSLRTSYIERSPEMKRADRKPKKGEVALFDLYPTEYKKTPRLENNNTYNKYNFTPRYEKQDCKPNFYVGHNKVTNKESVKALEDLSSGIDKKEFITLLNELGKLSNKFPSMKYDGKGFEKIAKDVRNVYLYNFKPEYQISKEIMNNVTAKMNVEQASR